MNRMNKVNLFQIGFFFWMMNKPRCSYSYKMLSTPDHCVLVLIGYRINLLLFVSTKKIVPLLLKDILTKRIEQILILSPR